MAWGIHPNASAKEKIKAEYDNNISGMKSCGVIDYYAYCKLFDFSMDILDRMYELGHQEEMEMKRFERGQEVWVVVRDEWGDAADVSGYMVFDEVSGYVIACSYVYDADSWEETVEYMIEQQQEWDDPQFFVFPLKDCYTTREEAESAV